MADTSRKWLTAADCAARTGLTVRALRVYEREGLLKPGRAANGWRRYGPEDLLRLNTISVLKTLGLTLAQIRKLLRETNPSLLSVLQVQATSWRERHAEAAKALEVVEAAIHRLERSQPLSLEELCQLVNALQARSTPMQNRGTLFADLMQELLTTEERWEWQTWWASHPEDLNQNNSYLRERAECNAVMLDQHRQGLSPGDPAVQEQLSKQQALLGKYGVRERTVRMMDWNPALTTKFMELGVIARERHPDQDVLPFPLQSRQLADFFDAAMRVWAPVQAMGPVIKSAEALLQAHADPGSAVADAAANAAVAVCAEHGLGAADIYLRFVQFIARVNHRPLKPEADQALEFLAQACRLRRKDTPAAAEPASVRAATAPLHFTAAEIDVVRRAFARQMGLMAGVVEPRVEAAFASVAREKFLGPGPWSVMALLRGTFMQTPDDSPAHVYVDSAVSIVAQKSLNNGQPSLYYRVLAETLVPEGAQVVHVGAGTGYYSAILAHLVGPAGRVTAIEYEADLAVQARTNLRDLAHVDVLHGDATQTDFAPADLILVSAGTTRPVDRWLDGLKDGGQLILPMTPDTGMGVIFGIRRRGERFFVAVLSPVMIYRCAGARDPQSAAALADALKSGGQRGVTRLYRGAALPLENSWLHGDDWCLAYA
ncbi:MAG TPA: MerR family transcriptional regulator [Steroidobacteraceae bacterium]